MCKINTANSSSDFLFPLSKCLVIFGIAKQVTKEGNDEVHHLFSNKVDCNVFLLAHMHKLKH